MASANDLLAESVLTHAVSLERFKAGVAQEVIAELTKLEAYLAAQVQGLDPDGPMTLRQQRAIAMLGQTKATIAQYYTGVAKVTGSKLAEVAKLEAKLFDKGLQAALGVGINTTVVSATLLEQVAEKTVVRGAKVADWWARQADDLTMKFADTVNQGVLIGKGIDDIVRDVRGTKAAGYSDGIMQVKKHQADALVRTGVQSVAQEARKTLYEANGDLLKGFQWLSTLDGRTSDICIARSGLEWDVTGSPIGHEVPLDGPPAHWNCRSTLVPVMKSWEELAGKPILPKGKTLDGAIADAARKQGLGPDAIASLLARTQSSMDGQVAASLDFEAWLKGKPIEFQIDVLGAAKHALWKEGKISLKDLIDGRGNPLSLADLMVKVETGKTIAAQQQVVEAAKDALQALGAAKKAAADAIKVSKQTVANANLPEEQGKALVAYFDMKVAGADIPPEVMAAYDGANSIVRWALDDAVEQQRAYLKAKAAVEPAQEAVAAQKAGIAKANLAQTAKDPSKTATFVPGADWTGDINGIELKAIDAPEDWAKVPGTKAMPEPPPAAIEGKTNSAGLIMVEDDGRVWLVEPKDHFGGYEHTFPKGGVEKGLTLQQTAVKEAWEESGLFGQIIGTLGDYEGKTTVTRYYIAKRTGGAPWAMGWESQAVKLTPLNSAESFLNVKRDRAILADLKAKLAKATDAGNGDLEKGLDALAAADTATMQVLAAEAAAKVTLREIAAGGPGLSNHKKVLDALKKKGELAGKTATEQLAMVNAGKDAIIQGSLLAKAKKKLAEGKPLAPTEKAALRAADPEVAQAIKEAGAAQAAIKAAEEAAAKAAQEAAQALADQAKFAADDLADFLGPPGPVPIKINEQNVLSVLRKYAEDAGMATPGQPIDLIQAKNLLWSKFNALDAPGKEAFVDALAKEFDDEALKIKMFTEQYSDPWAAASASAEGVGASLNPKVLALQEAMTGPKAMEWAFSSTGKQLDMLADFEANAAQELFEKSQAAAKAAAAAKDTLAKYAAGESLKKHQNALAKLQKSGTLSDDPVTALAQVHAMADEMQAAASKASVLSGAKKKIIAGKPLSPSEKAMVESLTAAEKANFDDAVGGALAKQVAPPAPAPAPAATPVAVDLTPYSGPTYLSGYDYAIEELTNTLKMAAPGLSKNNIADAIIEIDKSTDFSAIANMMHKEGVPLQTVPGAIDALAKFAYKAGIPVEKMPKFYKEAIDKMQASAPPPVGLGGFTDLTGMNVSADNVVVAVANDLGGGMLESSANKIKQALLNAPAEGDIVPLGNAINEATGLGFGELSDETLETIALHLHKAGMQADQMPGYLAQYVEDLPPPGAIPAIPVAPDLTPFASGKALEAAAQRVIDLIKVEVPGSLQGWMGGQYGLVTKMTLPIEKLAAGQKTLLFKTFLNSFKEQVGIPFESAPQSVIDAIAQFYAKGQMPKGQMPVPMQVAVNKLQAGAPAAAPAAAQAAQAATKVVDQAINNAARAEATAKGELLFADMRQVGPQRGSNLGGLFEDSKTGEKWYIKASDQEDVVRNELLAHKLYTLAGIETPELRLIDIDGTISGSKVKRVGIASKFVEGLTNDKAALIKKPAGVADGFATDAWLSNWDVVGLSYDNLLIRGGKAFRVDVGGSLRYRAQGGLKSDAQFGPSVADLDTLRDASVNPQTASVFGKLTNAEVEASVARVLRISDDDIRRTVEEFGPRDKATADKLVATLIARKKDLAKRYPKAAKAIEEAPLPPPTAGISKFEADQIRDSRLNGFSVRVDKDQIEDQQVLFYQYTDKAGKKRTAAYLKVLPQASRDLYDRIGVKAAAGNTAKTIPGAIEFDDLDAKVLTAIKGVASRAKQGVAAEAKDVERVLAARQAYNEAIAKFEKLAGQGYYDPASIDAMKLHYGGWVEMLEDATKAGAGKPMVWNVPDAQVFAKWAAPTPKSLGKQAVKADTLAGLKWRSEAATWNEMEITKGFAKETGGAAYSSGNRLAGEGADGTLVKFVPENHSAVALRGRIEISVEGDDAAAASKIMETLKGLGINADRASPLDQEELYLIRLAYARRDGFAEFRRKVEGMADQPARVQAMKDWLSAKIGKKVDALPGYDPKGALQQFGHGRHQVFRPDLTGPEWEKFQQDYVLHHSVTGDRGVETALDRILESGAQMAPTIDKLRRGITPRGMSPEQDLRTGGASYFFTRIKARQSGMGSSGFVWKSKLVSRLDAISYSGDMYGKVDTESFVLGNRKVSVAEWRSAAQSGSNETIFKDSLSLFDDLEAIVVGSPDEKARVLKVLAKHGIKDKWPDGRKTEDVVRVGR